LKKLKRIYFLKIYNFLYDPFSEKFKWAAAIKAAEPFNPLSAKPADGLLLT
jgi:hypothetical protein